MNKLLFTMFALVFSVPAFAQSPLILDVHPLDKMPLVQSPMFNSAFGFAPEERRDEQYRKWLSASVKISVTGASGSGTIVYYDRAKNTAYVASCGHLWNGSSPYQPGKSRDCKIIVWYHNNEKLSTPREYPAKVLFWSNHPNPDTSLLTFQPDWEPNYFPIAPVDHPISPGELRHSLGCDGGREVAHYDVEIVGIDGNNLITRRNSPRPGRSGGGLMDDKFYIATCWGTSNYNGSGIGYFTPLSHIHRVWKQNGHEFLLKIPPPGGLARNLPIVDRNNPQGTYPKNYIPLPH